MAQPIQRHVPEKSGPDIRPSTGNVVTANHPYPWPRTKYNEYLAPFITNGLARNHHFGTMDAANHPGIYHPDLRPAYTIQQLIVPAGQNKDVNYG